MHRGKVLEFSIRNHLICYQLYLSLFIMYLLHLITNTFTYFFNLLEICFCSTIHYRYNFDFVFAHGFLYFICNKITML